MQYVVAVRSLCEFTAKLGDLDMRFTPSPSASEGMAGHAMVAARRDSNYETEIVLNGEYEELQIRGRADGYDPAQNQLEEIKTHRGPLERMPANHRHLHWAQLKIYGWLLCRQRTLSHIRLALVYFDLSKQRESLVVEDYSADVLREFFTNSCERFLVWARQELRHRNARNAAMRDLRFPYASFHAGQRELAESVFRAVSTGRCLLAEAPTGIGKTVATLFPLLKALPSQELDKVLFLTARTPGRKLALDTLQVIRKKNPEVPLRVLELVARNSACEHPDKLCHGESCPLAAGFYDRLPAARSAALSSDHLDRSAIRSTALAHQVCPYYLGQELARWADVIVGDYNYYFDYSAMLFRMATTYQWRMGVLVDEGHNLLTRSREMYSAELQLSTFKSVMRTAPQALRKVFQRVAHCWEELLSDQSEPYSSYEYTPDGFVAALDDAVAAIGEHLAEDPAPTANALLDFYFNALHFCRIAESFDAHSLFDITRSADEPHQIPMESVLCIRNVVPAVFLQSRLAAARTTVLFSATLSPEGFYRDMFGLPKNTTWLTVTSPFSSEQLSVKVTADISTRFRHRRRSFKPIVDLMASQYQQQPGNYLAFFSSFDYLDAVVQLFEQRHPYIAIWKQERAMPERARTDFLQRFSAETCGIGFATLGGAFAEGIDLPGDRLIGAFIATLGLPQVNAVNEALRTRMDALFIDGYDYAYTFPGLQKVVQAAGRVIRTTQDRGVVYLMDDRFSQPKIRQLLPSWWRVELVNAQQDTNALSLRVNV